MTKKRGYSRAFTPRAGAGHRYLLHNIPPGLWRGIQAKAKREGLSVRAAILTVLTKWIAEGA